jgi:phospholipid-binding lipoprotein MlaA
VLPLLGPSDVRDGVGVIPDHFLSIDGQIGGPVGDGLMAGGKVDGREKVLPYDKVIDAAFDPYAMVRDVWFQKRDYKVHGGVESKPPTDPGTDPGETTGPVAGDSTD